MKKKEIVVIITNMLCLGLAMMAIKEEIYILLVFLIPIPISLFNKKFNNKDEKIWKEFNKEVSITIIYFVIFCMLISILFKISIS